MMSEVSLKINLEIFGLVRWVAVFQNMMAILLLILQKTVAWAIIMFLACLKTNREVFGSAHGEAEFPAIAAKQLHGICII